MFSKQLLSRSQSSISIIRWAHYFRAIITGKRRDSQGGSKFAFLCDTVLCCFYIQRIKFETVQTELTMSTILLAFQERQKIRIVVICKPLVVDLCSLMVGFCYSSLTRSFTLHEILFRVHLRVTQCEYYLVFTQFHACGSFLKIVRELTVFLLF